MYKIVRIFIATLLVLTVIGCAGSPITSSLGYYGPVPGPQKVKDSRGQYVQRYLVSHDATDTREAVIKGAGFMGLAFDNIKEDMLTGAGQWMPPGFGGVCSPSQVYAVYLTKIDTQETNVTIVVDHVSFCASLSNLQIQLAQQMGANMNKVLATFE